MRQRPAFPVLFNSYVFILLFLPITLVGFYWLSKAAAPRVAKAWLVAASLFYYAWWNPAYLGLLLASLLVNYAIGLALASGGGATPKRQLLLLGVILNLGALGWFKYANFFVDNLNAAVGFDWHLQTIILPLGISFFTFQQIAYLVDASRGLTREYRFLDYALFVSFFPQLIAGPIVHHKEMMPQFARESTYRFDPLNLATGLSIFAFGLFKKVIIADTLGAYATGVFQPVAEPGTVPSPFDAWGGALAYTGQLYFDFSGYSDMAIGLARMFGIWLPLNFDSPYKSGDIIAFWRRWHITLSRFLRDYLYIPLGGNRRGPIRRYANLLITMTLGGLWHGAGWTFVLWGALHGVYLMINHGWQQIVGGRETDKTRLWAWGVTFVAVVIGWVFFRSADLPTAGRMLAGMLGLVEPTLDSAMKPRHFGVVLLCLAVAWLGPNVRQIFGQWQPSYEPMPEGEQLRGWKSRLAWQPTLGWALVSSVIFVIGVLSLSNVSEFLYFQF